VTTILKKKTVFSMVFDLRLYNESLSIGREFRELDLEVQEL
jgi:hypothetical protein